MYTLCEINFNDGKRKNELWFKLKQINEIKHVGSSKIIPHTIIDNDEYLITADKKKIRNIINMSYIDGTKIRSQYQPSLLPEYIIINNKFYSAYDKTKFKKEPQWYWIECGSAEKIVSEFIY